ncbi:MAG: serine hydrolase, partial [Cyclobacteriaceae bacterium]
EINYFKELNIHQTFQFLEIPEQQDASLLLTATPATLADMGFLLGKQLINAGLDGCILKNISYLDREQAENFSAGIRKSGLILIEGENPAEAYRLDTEEVKKPKKQYESYQNFRNIHVHQLADRESWLTDWLNNDFLIIEEQQINYIEDFRREVSANKWYRKIASEKSALELKLIDGNRITPLALPKVDWEDLYFSLLRESCIIIQNDNNLPFPALDDRFVFLGPERTSALSRSMNRYAETTFLSWQEFDDEPEKVFTEIAQSDQLVLLYRKPEDLRLIRKMIDSGLKYTILTEYPESVSSLTNVGSVIYLNGLTSGQQDIIGQILFGGISAGGYQPFSVDNNLRRGKIYRTPQNFRMGYNTPESRKADKKILADIDSIVAVSIREGAFPGCQIAVVRKNTLLYEKSFGYFTYDSIFRVQTHHLYDLASITKVAATLQAVMFLHEQGMISLDDKLSDYLPALNETNKADLTIRKVLMHESGLKPYLPFWKVSLEKDLLNPYVYQSESDSLNDNKTFDLYYPSPRDKAVIWQEIIDSDLRKLGKNDSVYNYRYSDLGFMFLQMLVEEVSQQGLDEFLNHNIYQPLGLRNTLFNPLLRFDRKDITPTEYDYYFRNSQIWGTVHDQNAQVLGGVAGHAGLFSNAHDLSKLMLMNLNGGRYGNYRLLHDQTLKYFTDRQKENNRRGLGWDKPGEEDENTSNFASARTYGHTGFTGTAVWVDPEHDLIFVFLSNRVYPSAENKKLMENNIRIKIQDVIYKAIGADL